MVKYLIFPVVLIVLVLSCSEQSAKNEDMPVARVYDKYLYSSELKAVVPLGLSKTDSLSLIKDYIDKWVRKQLLLYQAEKNLTPSEKDVQKQIDDYRTSLLIFIYEQNLIQQKLDTIVSREEIMQYYNENTSNFILNQNLVKALYIKVPKTAPEVWKLRRWYKADDKESLRELEAYCYNNAEKYDYFNEDWVNFSIIEDQLPKMYSTSRNIISSRSTIELQDTSSYYFVRIYDYRLEGTVSPLEEVEHKIKSIIINKRKIQHINHLEADIYKDALDHGDFNIY